LENIIHRTYLIIGLNILFNLPVINLYLLLIQITININRNFGSIYASCHYYPAKSTAKHIINQKQSIPWTCGKWENQGASHSGRRTYQSQWQLFCKQQMVNMQSGQTFACQRQPNNNYHIKFEMIKQQPQRQQQRRPGKWKWKWNGMGFYWSCPCRYIIKCAEPLVMLTA